MEARFGFGLFLEALNEHVSAVGHSRASRVFILVMIMAVGGLVRLDALFDYYAEPDRFFYLGEPFERSVDGYRTLTHARDLITDSYKGLDTRRTVPEYSERPSPPLLMAVLAAGINQLTGISLNWIGGFLPVLLGPLIALPLYGLGRHYGGTAMGMSSALLGTLAYVSAARSSFGWFDTDCLNVTLLLSTAYFALRFGTTTEARRYYYFAAYVAVTLTFVLWWWPIRGVVLLMSMVPLAVALLFHYRPPRKEALIVTGLVLTILAIFLPFVQIDLSEILTRVSGLYNYISQAPRGNIPILGQFNQEQMRLPFEVLVAWTGGNLIGFTLGCLGIAWLFIQHFRTALYLSAIAVVSLLGAFYALRFVIFLTPFLSLGVGFILAKAWKVRKRAAWSTLLPFVVLPSMLWPQLSTLIGTPTTLHHQPQLFEALATTGRALPEDAVIWTSWGNGNIVYYWSDRGTIADGDYHGSYRSIYNYFPLAVENDRLAANFMRFYIARGRGGIGHWTLAHSNEGNYARAFTLLRDLLAGGPQRAKRLLTENPIAGERSADEWVEFLFPTESRPLYLLLDASTATTLPNWWRLGTWDFDRGDGDSVHYQIFASKEPLVIGDLWREALVEISNAFNNLEIDPHEGILNFEGKQLTLSNLRLVERGKTRTEYFPNSLGYTFEINADTGVFSVMTPRVSWSVFNRRFVRQSSSEYFVPIDLGAPYYQIWEVHADSP